MTLSDTQPHPFRPGRVIDTMPPVRYCACGRLASDPIHTQIADTQMMDDLLTEAEREALRLSGQLANAMFAIVGHGPTRDADCAEIAADIHRLQHAIMGQAAARAYPTQLRLLGETLKDAP